MWRRTRSFSIRSERIELRLPKRSDYVGWARQRRASREFHRPWVPTSFSGDVSRAGFRRWVSQAHRTFSEGSELNLLLFRNADQALLGSLACKNIRRGTVQCGTLSFWIGREYARLGYMTEAVTAFVNHAFTRLDLGRLEAACLPENRASRGLLEKTGFREEGRAEAYLRIAGAWRDHILFSNIREDRRESARRMETLAGGRMPPDESRPDGRTAGDGGTRGVSDDDPPRHTRRLRRAI